MTKAKRVDKRTDADRAARGLARLTLRLPAAILRQLEQLAKRRKSHRVTVLCDLIQEAAAK